MTFVVAVTSPRAIWMLADRRLSPKHGPRRREDENAHKMLCLEASDGDALIGYAGVGRTDGGTQPADWMARVFRGRDCPIEHSLIGLANAVAQHLLPHAHKLETGHNVVAACFVNREPRMYAINLFRRRGHYAFECVRVGPQCHRDFGQRGAYIITAGSGAGYLERSGDIVPLKAVIRGHTLGKITPVAVAKYLARLNHTVHQRAEKQRDFSVGPKCTVAWRFAKGGGAFEHFIGLDHDETPSPLGDPLGVGDHNIPIITRGTHLNALLQAVMPFVQPIFDAGLEGRPRPELDESRVNEVLRGLPEDPDERLK